MKLIHKFSGGVSLSLLLGVFVPVPTFAATTADPNAGVVAGIEIAESVKYELLSPDVSIGKDGNILVVWNQEDLAGSDPFSDPMSIAFAIYDSAGTLLTGPTEVGQVPYGDSYYRVQMAAYNETHDEWLIVWSDYDDQFMQRVDGDGTLIGSTVTMSKFVTLATDRSTQLLDSDGITPWQSNQNGPLQVKWDPTREEYLVTVWDDRDVTISGATGQRVWANFYDVDLLPVDGNQDLFLVGDPAVPAESNGDGMSIALDEANSVWAISFNSSVNNIGPTSKVLTLLDRSSAGLTQTHHVVLDSNSAELPTQLHAAFPQVTFIDSSGLFLVTFNAKFDSAVVPGSVATAWQTFGRLVDNTGALQGSTTAISDIPSLYTDLTDPVNPVVDYPEMRNVRPHYDEVNDRLYFAGHVDQQIVDPDFGLQTVYRSYTWSLAGDLTDPSDPVPMFALPQNPIQTGQSARPAIDVRGGQVAITYMNWPNGDYAKPAQLQLVIDGEYRGTIAAPAPYTGPLLQEFSSRTLDVCTPKSITITGTRLSGVTASVQGKVATVLENTATKLVLAFPSGLTPGNDVDLVINSSYGTLTHQDAFDVAEDNCIQSETVSSWTKNLNDGTAKMYAKNIVGAGKVQFMLNGKEIAWVRATSAADSKLRTANGASYLVRTVDLVEGQKNVLEIYVDGVRTTRTAYTY